MAFVAEVHEATAIDDDGARGLEDLVAAFFDGLLLH